MKHILFFVSLFCTIGMQAAEINITPDSSLTDAIRKAREMRRLGKVSEVTINLGAGTYFLSAPRGQRSDDGG